MRAGKITIGVDPRRFMASLVSSLYRKGKFEQNGKIILPDQIALDNSIRTNKLEPDEIMHCTNTPANLGLNIRDFRRAAIETLLYFDDRYLMFCEELLRYLENSGVEVTIPRLQFDDVYNFEYAGQTNVLNGGIYSFTGPLAPINEDVNDLVSVFSFADPIKNEQRIEFTHTGGFNRPVTLKLPVQLPNQDGFLTLNVLEANFNLPPEPEDVISFDCTVHGNEAAIIWLPYGLEMSSDDDTFFTKGITDINIRGAQTYMYVNSPREVNGLSILPVHMGTALAVKAYDNPVGNKRVYTSILTQSGERKTIKLNVEFEPDI